MKKKKKVQLKRGAAAILIGGILLCPSPIVRATNIVSISSTNSENVKASKGLNLYLDDRVFVPTDVNGNIVDVYAIDGTTYLPARAIAEATGASVTWDGLTNTVTIDTNANNEKKNNTPFVEPCKPENVNITINKNIKLVINGETVIPVNANGQPVDVFGVNGTTYLPLRYILSELEIPIEWEGYSNSVFMGKHMEQDNPYNYDNQYQRRAQAILNYTEIILNQCTTDSVMIDQQLIKVKDLIDYIKTIRSQEGYDSACYIELDPIYQTLLSIYTTGLSDSSMIKNEYYEYLNNLYYDLEYTVNAIKTEKDMKSFLLLERDASTTGAMCYGARKSCFNSEKYELQIKEIVSKYGKTMTLDY